MSNPEHLTTDSYFAKMMGGNTVEDFVIKYNEIIDRLELLENEYKIDNPEFDISNMWTCHNLHGSTQFVTLKTCEDLVLRSKIEDIFRAVLMPS